MKQVTRQRLVSEQEEQLIQAAVQEAEKHTSGEIVCMMVPFSYHYPMADVIGAAALALPLSLVATPLLGGWLWLGTQNMWLFLGIFALLFITGLFTVKASPKLKRLFIANKEMEAEVAEAAVVAFYRNGLYLTRDRTGVLLYISLLEHKVWLLADKGIDAKVPAGHWDVVVSRLTEGLRRHQTAAAIRRAITSIGEELRRHFPVRPEDTNELPDVITSGDASA